MTVSGCILLTINVSEKKILEKIKTRVLRSIAAFSESRAVYYIMRKIWQRQAGHR